MLSVAINCVRGRATLDAVCPALYATIPPGDVAAWAAQAVVEAGWTVVDGQYFCPQHDPAHQGKMVQVGVKYVEIAPGVRVRLPHGHFGDSFPFEVLLGKEI